MTFFEAIAHLRENGGRVALVNKYGSPSEAAWCDGVMQWVNSWLPVASCPTTIDGEWFIVQPPPKSYTFAEAYAMMKAGKWMFRVKRPECAFRLMNGKWYRKRHSDIAKWNVTEELVNTFETSSSILFSSEDIESQWQEANP